MKQGKRRPGARVVPAVDSLFERAEQTEFARRASSALHRRARRVRVRTLPSRPAAALARPHFVEAIINLRSRLLPDHPLVF